ncbi:hypothetical protein ACK6XA_004777, partial [Vibrio alginolyticus]
PPIQVHRKATMRDTALFFPFISIPEEQWTYQTLLYWDRLASIVPFDHMESPKQMTPFMRTLLREGLVDRLHPGQYIYEIEGFDSNFITLIESKLSRVRAIQQKFPQHKVFGKHRQAPIHAEKLGIVQNYLVSKGLAVRDTDDWYIVEAWAANLFMAYLASCLGALEEVNAAPVTNRVNIANLYANFTGDNISQEGSAHSSEARKMILNALLPYPNEPIKAADLFKFKEQHGHLLPAFRNRIEGHCITVAQHYVLEERMLLNENFINDSLDEIAYIESRMKPFWKKLTFSSITPIVGASISAAATQVDQNAALTGAVVTLSSTIIQAVSTIREDRRVTNAPLAYVARSRGGLA